MTSPSFPPVDDLDPESRDLIADRLAGPLTRLRTATVRRWGQALRSALHGVPAPAAPLDRFSHAELLVLRESIEQLASIAARYTRFVGESAANWLVALLALLDNEVQERRVALALDRARQAVDAQHQPPAIRNSLDDA